MNQIKKTALALALAPAISMGVANASPLFQKSVNQSEQQIHRLISVRRDQTHILNEIRRGDYNPFTSNHKGSVALPTFIKQPHAEARKIIDKYGPYLAVVGDIAAVVYFLFYTRGLPEDSKKTGKQKPKILK